MRYVLILFFCGIMASKDLHASGITLHMYMADLAVEQVNNPELKEFLIKNKNAIRNGSIYPDSGYIQKNGHADFSHWDEFLNEYVRYLDQNCLFPLSSKCERLFAFFLGSLAHTLGDVNFDRYFVQELARREFHGSANRAQMYTDVALDLLAILEYGRGTVIPFKWTPKSHLVKIYESLGKNVSRKEITHNTTVLYAALIGERIASPFTYFYYKKRSTWAPKNYFHAKGGIQDSAKVIAAMWEKIWFRWKRDRRFAEIAKLKREGGWPNIDFYLAE